MLTDISCPTEFRTIEQVEFEDGRRLAYLTFLNESDEIIIGLTGHLTMLNEKRQVIDRRRVSFKKLNVRPREAYVLNLRLDDYPAFSDAHMSVESISFLMQDSWQSGQSKPVNQKQQNAIPENEKEALGRIAKDAVCFPEQMGAYWTCVCGRHNQNEWNLCSGCGRIKQKVFREFQKEAVMAAHSNQGLSGDQTAKSARRRPPQSMEFIRQKEARIEKIERILLFVTLFVLVGALFLWGYVQTKNKTSLSGGELTSITVEQSPRSPTIDYLEPV